MTRSNSKSKKLSILARINYPGRITGCFLLGIIICALLYEGDFFFAWGFLIFHALLWPHLAYGLCRASKNSKAAELTNLLVDSFFYGLWIPIFSFQVVPSGIMIFAGCIANAFSGGFKFLLKGAASIMLGIMTYVLLSGHVEPAFGSSLLVESISVITMTIYLSLLGLQGYRQSNILIKVRDQLMEAKTAAELASQSKGEFLANMSHEIRTPMNGIIGAADLALAENISPKVSRYLQIISSSGQTLLGIINDILDFSKIEAGKLDLEIIPVNLSDIIITIGDIFSGQTAKKDIEFLFDVDPNIPMAVYGDPTRIKQILANLVSNAVKFTGSGGKIILGVRALKITEDRVLYEVLVKDTGKGMKKSYLNNLFNAFTQEDASTSRKYGGTGLGLSICKLLVAMMNGEIWGESEKGTGTTFFFTLDLERQPKARERTLCLPKDIARLKVMVVDDSKDSLDIIQKLLGSFGNESFLLQNPAGVEEIFSNNPFDLVITDWKMPEINGIELARRLRRIRPEIPIIILTAFGQEEEKKAAEAAGIKVFLTKPISSVTLFDAIIFVFGKGRKQKGEMQKTSVYLNYIMEKDIRVLLAEDHLTNQEIAKAVLGQAGVQVDIANNGLEAVELVKKYTYDAVLMDIQMPGMDGYEATRIIRQDPRFAKLPIIAMTAHAMKGDEDACLKAGMNGYVSKPIRQDVLFRTLWKKIEAGLDTAAADEVETIDTRLIDPIPDGLPGINVSGALAALGIDWAVYKTILQGFRRNNFDIISQMMSALNKNDNKALRQSAHSLKGTAASIGAEALASLAQQLEDAAGNNTASASQIDHIKSVLDEVFTSIRSLADKKSNDSDSIPPVHTAPKIAEEAINRVIISIEDSDPDRIESELEKLEQLFPSSWLTETKRQLAAYKFEEAVETLKKLRDEL